MLLLTVSKVSLATPSRFSTSQATLATVSWLVQGSTTRASVLSPWNMDCIVLYYTVHVL